MSDKPMNAEQFLADVANHELTIKQDNGLYRHLYFRQLGNSNMWFEIVTWPGALTINGDMGSWSFSRVDDMFRFFRSKELRINSSYWAEKITSESRYGGKGYTYHFLWCLHAIVWAIQQYDAARVATPVEATA